MGLHGCRRVNVNRLGILPGFAQCSRRSCFRVAFSDFVQARDSHNLIASRAQGVRTMLRPWVSAQRFTPPSLAEGESAVHEGVLVMRMERGSARCSSRFGMKRVRSLLMQFPRRHRRKETASHRAAAPSFSVDAGTGTRSQPSLMAAAPVSGSQT